MFQLIIQTELLEEILIGSKLSKKNYFDRPDLACSEKQVLWLWCHVWDKDFGFQKNQKPLQMVP